MNDLYKEPQAKQNSIVDQISRSKCVMFLKLGGSLITDKTKVQVVRNDVLQRVSKEIGSALRSNSNLKLLLGHGSGSFGHVTAAKFGTRGGVNTDIEWLGFAEVGGVASRLNSIVRDALAAEGMKVMTIQPSASVICRDGQIIKMGIEPIVHALAAGLVPIIYGDVAFDTARGGTIISTEEILSYLADKLKPTWLLLAGETPGVLDEDGSTIPIISRDNIEEIRPTLGSSRGTDVTGGMASKVLSMLDLVQRQKNLQIRVFSGLVPGAIKKALTGDSTLEGTLIRN